MAIKDVFKVSRKTFFNPRAWLGYDILKAETLFVGRLFRIVFKSFFVLDDEPIKKETFEQAVLRLKLTPQGIKDLETNYKVFALFFVFVGIFALTFSIRFLLIAYWGSFLLSFAITAFLLAQAFRYDFWRFQIKYRKLGCTFEEWRQGKPFDKGTSS